MHHHNFSKRRKKRKILLGGSILMLFAIITLFYLYKTFSPNIPKVPVVTTPTPVVPKPKPVTVPKLSIYPDYIEQGEPALITLEGSFSTTSVKSFTYDGRPLNMFVYENQISALLGVDLNSLAGTYDVVLTLKDGKEFRKKMVVNDRPLVRRKFDIPEKLGGNTLESERELIASLAKETKIINAIPTSKEKLWTAEFRFPFSRANEIEDPYGYTRILGRHTMPHKGTDFVAEMGTPIHAMNRGIVRLTDDLRNYGKTVVIDHGVGIQTVYMHLSEINVIPGEIVERGDIIAKSGDTGYVLNPHLHLTVKIWDIAIDPIKFLDLLGKDS